MVVLDPICCFYLGSHLLCCFESFLFPHPPPFPPPEICFRIEKAVFLARSSVQSARFSFSSLFAISLLSLFFLLVLLLLIVIFVFHLVVLVFI